MRKTIREAKRNYYRKYYESIFKFSRWKMMGYHKIVSRTDGYLNYLVLKHKGELAVSPSIHLFSSASLRSGRGGNRSRRETQTTPPQWHSPAALEGTWGIPRLEGTYNPSSESWVCTGASSQKDVPEKPPKVSDQEAFWPDTRNTSADSFQFEGAGTLLRTPSGWPSCSPRTEPRTEQLTLILDASHSATNCPSAC